MFMHIGDTRLFKKAAMIFCLVGLGLVAISFGSYYFGAFGFSFIPFAHWQDNGLWRLLYSDACRSAGGASAAAIGAYAISRRRQNEKSNNAT